MDFLTFTVWRRSSGSENVIFLGNLTFELGQIGTDNMGNECCFGHEDFAVRPSAADRIEFRNAVAELAVVRVSALVPVLQALAIWDFGAADRKAYELFRLNRSKEASKVSSAKPLSRT